MPDRKEKKYIVVNELYNKKKKGMYFYVQDYLRGNGETVKYFIDDKTFRKRNMTVVDLINYIEDCCWRYGIKEGLDMVDAYYNMY